MRAPNNVTYNYYHVIASLGIPKVIDIGLVKYDISMWCVAAVAPKKLLAYPYFKYVIYVVICVSRHSTYLGL